MESGREVRTWMFGQDGLKRQDKVEVLEKNLETNHQLKEMK